MSDYAISIKVRNGRIRRRLAECGFSSVGDLCRKTGLYPQQIGALLNLKVAPLTKSGSWRRSAVALADALGCTCEELFSDSQRTMALQDNRTETFISEGRLLRLSGMVERPLLENPEERLLEEADAQAKIALIRRALDGLKLPVRDRKIVEGHFGIGCEERTLADLALELSVSRQSVQRCLDRTLRRLRSHKLATTRSLMQAYQPAEAMGMADEARARRGQKRGVTLRAERPVAQRVHSPLIAPREMNAAMRLASGAY